MLPNDEISVGIVPVNELKDITLLKEHKNEKNWKAKEKREKRGKL